jgi:hypothetical protein
VLRKISLIAGLVATLTLPTAALSRGGGHGGGGHGGGGHGVAHGVSRGGWHGGHGPYWYGSREQYWYNGRWWLGVGTGPCWRWAPHYGGWGWVCH